MNHLLGLPNSTVAPNAGQTGLNILTFGNVAADMQNRHIGHFLVAIVLMSWTLFLLWREYNHYVDVRQAWLGSPQHLTLARTRTIAITSVPDSINSDAGLKGLAGTVARLTGTTNTAPRMSTATEGTVVAPAIGEAMDGGVRSVWLSRNVKAVEKVWENRDKECGRLEGGVAKLVKTAQKNVQKGKSPEVQGG